MEGYLGETEVNIQEHPEYSKYTPSEWALLYNLLYGGISGSHHKTWVLDQMTRILLNTPVVVTLASWENGHTEYRYKTGTPSDDYWKFVNKCRGEEVDGEYEYDYYFGIAP